MAWDDLEKYIVHRTLYIVHCTLYMVHGTLYMVRCTLRLVTYIVHCTPDCLFLSLTKLTELLVYYAA